MGISKLDGISHLPVRVQESPESTGLGTDSQVLGRNDHVGGWTPPKKAGLISRDLEGF